MRCVASVRNLIRSGCSNVRVSTLPASYLDASSRREAGIGENALASCNHLRVTYTGTTRSFVTGYACNFLSPSFVKTHVVPTHSPLFVPGITGNATIVTHWPGL